MMESLLSLLFPIFLVSLLTFFVFYYQFAVVSPVLFFAKASEENEALKRALSPILSVKYRPTFWCFESRMQTVVAWLGRLLMPDNEYRREVLTLNDGGEVVLDWIDNEEKKKDDNEKKEKEDNKGGYAGSILLLLPGLTGDSQSYYIKRYKAVGTRLGAKCVTFNYRGCGGHALRTARTYCAGNVDDLSSVIDHIRRIYPQSRLLALGTSLGGMKLGNYLAKEGSKARKKVEAAMIVSACFDWVKGTESLEQPGLNRLINYHMASCLVKFLKNVRHHFEDFLHLDHALSSQTIRDFDSRFTSRHFGYDSMQAYYAGVSLVNKLRAIDVPLLALNAADDPVQPGASLPIDEIADSEHVSLLLTRRGGHIGFLEGVVPTGDTLACRVLEAYMKHVLEI